MGYNSDHYFNYGPSNSIDFQSTPPGGAAMQRPFRNYDETIMLWCLGMYSSASTWAYNVTRQAAQALWPQSPVLAGFAHGKADLDRLRRGGVAVVKTHSAHSSVFEALDRECKTIILTVRDPRDAVASLIRYNGFDFGLACDLTAQTAHLCAMMSTDERATVLRYEDGFAERRHTVDRIAQALGNPLPAEDGNAIFAHNHRSAVEKFISRLETLSTARQVGDDIFDDCTHWHKHHSGRTGEVGRWRQGLTKDQAALVEHETSEAMEAMGYPLSEEL